MTKTHPFEHPYQAVAIFWSLYPGKYFSKKKLVATSLVTCMANPQISSKTVNIVFNRDDRSLHYNLDVVTIGYFLR